MTIPTVYDLGMAKYVYIQLFASGPGATVPPPLKIRADKLEKKQGGVTVLTLAGQEVGEFHSAIQGWWIQDEEK